MTLIEDTPRQLHCTACGVQITNGHFNGQCGPCYRGERAAVDVTLWPAGPDDLARAQRTVTTHHYLHTPVDSRCSPFAYDIVLRLRDTHLRAGVLIFGRPEATRCYDGSLTYGSLADVQSGRARYDRWEVLNLARVWLVPAVQAGGEYYTPKLLPGYIDRRGAWHSTLASSVIQQALGRIGYDYLLKHPPCFPDEPYEIKAVLSYCDTTRHKGTIYRAAGFELARTNERGIETWHAGAAPLSSYERDMIEKRASQSYRSRRHRARRAVREVQESF